MTSFTYVRETRDTGTCWCARWELLEIDFRLQHHHGVIVTGLSTIPLLQYRLLEADLRYGLTSLLGVLSTRYGSCASRCWYVFLEGRSPFQFAWAGLPCSRFKLVDAEVLSQTSLHNL